MNIRCIVVDDEPVALLKMQRYARQIPYLEVVAACDSPLEAMRVMQDNEVDAIFTDINMVGMNGLHFVSALERCPLVVFVTAYHEYAVESYKVGAVDYIMKPYGMEEFKRAAERVRMQYELMMTQQAAQREDALFVRADYKWVRIKTEEICYIQGLSDYLRIALTDAPKPLVTYATFAHIMSCLPQHFVQVHRSWIVNMERVCEIGRNRIVMDHDMCIPIGDKYRESLKRYLQGCSIGKSGRIAKREQ